MEDTSVLSDAHSQEAINAQAEAAKAIERARESQLTAAIKANREETLQIFVHAMREVLTQGDEGTKALLIQKIPLLCTDMLTMKNDIRDIKSDNKWQKWLLMGICGGIGLLALKMLGVQI